MYAEAFKRLSPVIVELGVDKSQSTRVFLNVIADNNNSRLISIDIKDFRNAVKSEN
jgi:uncharacterized SAM-dependent methyltransferase